MASPELDALLLAAGYGTRLRPLTEQIPKALLPIYGVPMLDYHLERLLGERPAWPIRRVVVNGHHLAEALRAHLEADPWHGRVTFSFEPEIRGTGGAIAHAAANLRSDPVLVLNAKALMPSPPLAQALALHHRGGCGATMILARAPAWANVRVQGERVTAILRNQREEGAWAFTGVQLVSQEIVGLLPAQGFHDIRDTYDPLMARRRIGAYLWDPKEEGAFLAVETPGDYLEAHRACAAAGAQRFGLTIPRAHTIRLAEGYGFVDAAAVIGPGCRIEESVVLAGASVEPGVRLRRCVVGPGVAVGTDAEGLLLTTLGSRGIE